MKANGLTHASPWQRAMEQLKRLGLVQQAGTEKRDRVYYAKAITLGRTGAIVAKPLILTSRKIEGAYSPCSGRNVKFLTHALSIFRWQFAFDGGTESINQKYVIMWD